MEARECVLCGDGCPGRYGVPRPVILIGDDGPIQELPSYWCASGDGWNGSDVVMLDGWALVADHTTEQWMVKLGQGAAEPAFFWKMWRDEQKKAQVVIVQPREHLRGVRLWFTDEYQRERAQLVPAW
jgi:hypothetical protein